MYKRRIAELLVLHKGSINCNTYKCISPSVKPHVGIHTSEEIIIYAVVTVLVSVLPFVLHVILLHFDI